MPPTTTLIGEPCGADTMWPLLSAPHPAEAMMFSRSHKQAMDERMSGDVDPIKVSGVNGCKIEKEKTYYSLPPTEVKLRWG